MGRWNVRTSAEKFTTALKNYLQGAISERVAEANREDPSLRLPDIAGWSTGYDGVLAGLQHYPGCIILVNRRTLVDCWTTAFSVVVGIGLTADEPAWLERMGRAYEDILEDCIRSDWHLGGAALDTDLGIQMDSDCTSNVYLIQATMTCEVDIGGFVYEHKEGDGGADVVPLSEVSEELRPSAGGDGPLSSLPQPSAEGDGGVSEEEGPVREGGVQED